MRTTESPEGEGHPTCKHVYEKIIREHFVDSPLHDIGAEPFAREVAKRFRKAPMTLCSRSIGKWINRKLREAGRTQQNLADRVGVDRSAVAYWVRGGNITLDNLAQVLIEFKSQWTELPIPARQEMAIAAYLAALTFVRERLAGAPPGKPLDHVTFWSLYHLLSERYWAEAMRLSAPDLLSTEAQRVAQAVEASLGHRPPTAVSVASLQRLTAEWAGAWLVCIGSIPCAWATQ